MKNVVCLFICLGFVSACNDETKVKERLDLGVVDSGSDSSVDVGSSDSGEADTSTDIGKDSSMRDLPDGGPELGVVVVGERCSPKELSGVVRVEKFQKVQVSARLFDKPLPSIGAPVLTDNACLFYEFLPGANCASCANDKTCNADSVCVVNRQSLPNASLKISDGTTSLNLTTDQFGSISGQVALSGDRFSIELSVGGRVLNLPPTSLPSPLEGVVSNLTGSYDNPEAMDLSWDLPADPARVFTHVPMNHHVGLEATFTECEVDAQVKSLHIDGAMLKPLAVATGLEFQTIDHVRFAAAQTEQGCIEFRFLRSTFP